MPFFYEVIDHEKQIKVKWKDKYGNDEDRINYTYFSTKIGDRDLANINHDDGRRNHSEDGTNLVAKDDSSSESDGENMDNGFNREDFSKDSDSDNED
eukprot:14671495-Ditylum_brightwellii.AAC.1